MKRLMILTLLSVITLATRAADYNYLVFTLNRKVLSEIAIHDPAGFKTIVEIARGQ